MIERTGRPHGRCGSGFPMAAILLLGLAGLAVQGCSSGENRVVNPGSTRSDLLAPPDTIGALAVTEGGTYVPEIKGMFQQSLKVARTDSLTSIAYVRFGTLPDTAGVASVSLEIRVRNVSGIAPRLAVYPVTGGTPWKETDLGWSDEPVLASAPAATTDPITVSAPADTVVVTIANLLDLFRQWRVKPDSTNLGLGLRVVGDTPDTPGSLDIFSRDLVLSGSSVGPLLKFRMRTGDSTAVRATDDTYIYHPAQPEMPPDSLLAVSDWLPRRAFIELAVPDSLLPASGGARGWTVNRAQLVLHVETQTDSMGTSLGIYGAYRSGSDPTTFSLVGPSVTLVVPARTDSMPEPYATMTAEIPGILQRWLDGSVNGIVLATTHPGTGTDHLRVASGSASASRRAVLAQLVATPPPGERWNPRRAGR